MIHRGIQCSFLPLKRRESLYNKFKETHPKTSIMSFTNYLNYASTYNGLDLNSTDDIILNKVTEALKHIEEKKINTHTLLPNAKVLDNIKSAEDELYSIKKEDGNVQIEVHDVPLNMIDDVIESIVENFGIEDNKVISNLRNNLQSTNRMNVFLRFLAKEQLYAETTEADNTTIVGNAIKYANTFFANTTMFKEDGTNAKEELENDFSGVVQPFSESKSGFIGSVTGKGYNAADAFRETNQANIEGTDATVIIRPFTNGNEGYMLKSLGEKYSSKVAAQTFTENPTEAAQYVAKGLAKSEGSKVVNFKGNTLETNGWSQNEWNEYMFTLLQEAVKQGANIKEVRTDGLNGVGVATVIAASALGIKTSIIAPAYESKNGVVTYPTQPINSKNPSVHSKVHFGVFNSKKSDSKTAYLNRFSKSTVDKLQARLETSQVLQSTNKEQENLNSNQFYKGMITAEDDAVFVFGSNAASYNGNPAKGTGGAALSALQQGRIEQTENMANTFSKSGRAYGIQTVTRPGARNSLSKEEIVKNIQKMYQVATNNPQQKFKVAYTNVGDKTSLNGYSGNQMIDMFIEAGPIPSNVIFSKEWGDTGKFNNTPRLTKDTKINIYAGTNENADLSNFAKRPFIITNTGIEPDGPVAGKFQTVEGAFQAQKLFYSGMSEEQKETIRKQLETATGKQARSIGRNIQDLDTKAWDQVSSNLMYNLLTTSFEQNPKALQRLLDTGNATLTHTQDKGKWGTEFPKLLMKVREELGNQRSTTSLDNSSSRQEINGDIMNVINEIENSLNKVKQLAGISPVISDTSETSTSERADVVKNNNPVIEAKAHTVLVVNNDSPRGRLYRLINPQTAQQRETMIARDFREMVDMMIDETLEEIEDRLERDDEESLAKRLDDLELQKALTDDNTARKTFIVQTGVDNIFNRVKEKYQRLINKPNTSEYEKSQYQIVVDNFDTLLSSAKVIIESKENLIIDKSKDSEDEGDTREMQEGASGNDGWVVKARTTDPHSTISTLTRQALEDIRIINPETKIGEVDDLGYPLFYNEDDLHSILIKELASLISPDDFAVRENTADSNSKFIYPKLESLKDKYVWIEQLINKLRNDEQLTAVFYTDFRKDFISYWKSKGGKSIELNSDSGTESQFSLLDANYNSGLRLTDSSLYTSNSTIDKSNIKELEQLASRVNEAVSDLMLDRIEEDEIEEELIEPLTKLYKSLGFSVTKTDVQYIAQENLDKITDTINKVNSILQRLKITNQNDEEYVSENDSYTDIFRRELRDIAKVIGTVDAEYVIASLRQGDETRYSYSAPNYVDTMFKNLTHEDAKYRKEYIENKWGKYGWFRDQNTGEWKNTWLKELYEDAIKELEFKPGISNSEDAPRYLHRELKMKDIPYINDSSSRGEELVKYNDWTKDLIIPAYIGEYFAFPQSDFANYNFPIFADSPCAKFIKMRRYHGGNYKAEVLQEMVNVARQELWRMEFVEQRLNQRAEPIQNFDNSIKDGKVKYGRGSEFCFFPFLNTMTIADVISLNSPNSNGEEITEFINDYLDHLNATHISPNTTIKDAIVSLNGVSNVDAVDQLISDAIEVHLNNEFNNFFNENRKEIEDAFSKLRQNGVVESLGYSNEMVNENEEEVMRDLIQEYYWNQQFATSQIIQMTTTDLAFYKNATDFQKRYKEVYAAGSKLFTNSKYGRKYEKTLYLRDFSLTSRSWDNLKKAALEVRDRGELHDAEVFDILDKYISNNQVDAQAYRSISSYRAVLDMMGLWNESMDETLQRFQEGTQTSADFNVIWGTIKPFLYTVSESANGTNDASYGTIMTPHQNKNSEFVILSTIQAIGGIMSQSPKMKGLSRFMEDTGVDVVQFESAVKAGGQGIVDIGLSENTLSELAEIITKDKENNYVEEYLDKLNAKAKPENKLTELPAKEVVKYYTYGLTNGYITQEQFNKAMDALEPEEHEVYEKLINASVLNVDRDAAGNILYNGDVASFDGEVMFNNDRIHTHSYDDYMIAQPTPQHFLDTDAVFGSQFRNLIISDIPNIFGTDEKGNPKAISFKINGKTYSREELLDTYRKLITENLIDGYMKAMNRFTDIYSLQEFLKEQVQGNPKFPADMVDAFEIVETPKGLAFNIPLSNPSTTIKIQELINSTFKNSVTKQRIKGGSVILVSSFGYSKQLEVVRNKNGSIKEIQCYMPAYSKQFYEAFMGEDGTLDINKMPEDLRKVVGYRIPTENKYSMANLRIMGFLPQQNGGTIMLPAEITTMSGADFDVDKMFLMFPSFRLEEYNMDQAKLDYSKEMDQEGSLVNAILGTDESTKESFKEWWERKMKDGSAKYYKLESPIVEKVRYNHNVNDPNSIAEMSKEQRDNMLIDISYAILSHPAMAMNVNNPGSFDKIKRISRITEIAENPTYREAYMKEFNVTKDKLPQHLMGQTLDTLDDFLKEFAVERNPLSIDTFLYNHKQNTTGGTLIGIYANGTTGQAKFQESGLTVKDHFAFTINGRKMQRLDRQRTEPVNGVRELISKNSAEWSAASVDNVKDPVLAKLWQSKNTANITIALIRMGVTIDEVGLLFKHPVIQYLASEDKLTTKEINKLVYAEGGLMDTIEQSNLKGTVHFKNRENSNIDTNGILRDLIDADSLNYFVDNAEAAQRAIDLLSVFKEKILPIAEALHGLTKVTRADSPNGAIQRSLSRAVNQRIAVDNMIAKVQHAEFPLANTGVLGESGLLRNENGLVNSKEEIRDILYKEKGLVSPFYTLGIDAPIDIISNYFNNYAPWILDKVNYLARTSSTTRGTLSDDTMDALFFEMTTFLLSKTKLFGNDSDSTFEEKRNYYLYEFPKELIDIKQSSEYEDINNLTFMKKLQVVKGEIQLSNGGKLNASTRMQISQSIDALLYMGGENQEKAHQLAIDLMAYSYYRDGFRFGPNNYGTFFSTTFLNAFPELMESIRDYNLSREDVDNFLEQFISNHPSETSTYVRTVKGEIMDENISYDEGSEETKVTVKGATTMNLNLPKNFNGSYQVAQRLYINYSLFDYVGSEVNSRGVLLHHYEKVSTLPRVSDKKIDISRVKYNANMSREELDAVKVDEDKIKASLKLFSSSKKSKSKAKTHKLKAGTAYNANDMAKEVLNSPSEETSMSSVQEAYRDLLLDETQERHTTADINALKELRDQAMAESEENGNSNTLEEFGISHQSDSSIEEDKFDMGSNINDIKAAFAVAKVVKKVYTNNKEDKTNFC